MSQTVQKIKKLNIEDQMVETVPYTDLMVDFETLGTTLFPVVGSLGAVLFNSSTVYNTQTLGYLPACQLFLPFDEQLAKGSLIEQDTFDWWVEQGTMQGALIPKTGQHRTLYVFEALDNLENFISAFNSGQANKLRIWCKGLDFDMAILKNLYRIAGRKITFFKYNAGMDVRSVIRQFGGDAGNMMFGAVAISGTPHNPVYDCMVQIVQCQTARLKYNMMPF